MKIVGIICLVGILTACGSGNKSEKVIEEVKLKKTDVTRIEIKRTDFFHIETPYSIECDDFEEWGGNLLSSHSMEDKDSIAWYVNTINELEKAPIPFSMDVRAKMFFFYQDSHVDTICLGKFYIYRDGKYYNNSVQLKKMIDDL